MNRFLPALLIFATAAIAQDVYTPPVPIGIKRDGKVRTPAKPIPFPAEGEVWLRLRSPRFDIISSAPEERTRAMARDLETLASALHAPVNTPATVFVFAKRRESQPYFDLLIGRENTPVQGVYVRHEGGGTMFVDAGARDVERTSLHELTHDLLRQRTITPPLWIEEGLAEFFGGARIRKDVILTGGEIAQHIELLRRNPPASLDAMFAVRAESAEATSPLFYAQSWAAVDWLMHLDAAQFDPFLRDVASGTSVADALATHYAKTIDDLRNAVRKAGGGRTIKIAVAESAAETASSSIVELDRATLLFELGRFLSHVAGAGEESLRHYRAALDANPRHALSLAALGRFDEALASDPENVDVLLTYSESLLRDAIGPFASYYEPKPSDLDSFRKARAMAERALNLGGEDVRAHAIIGASYLVESDVAPAIPHLERVRELAPARMDSALHLYDLYLRTGDRAKADALFAAAFDRARDKQVVFAARNLKLRFETDRANALAREGKLDEAAAIVRELAAQTEEGFARKELEQQAAQLAATAAVNRHIEMYNRAVTMANSGRKLEAIKVLDELLRVATDAQVVRDAQRLRDKVRTK
ncbi:MAG: hypothetical protein DMF56_17340 [Acidobacteria bacterium]|nr:MAG: hypothetical protein DMF56_17340 [Acidobacteriota bacterium]